MLFFQPNLFGSREGWRKYRSATFFKNADELNRFQSRALERIASIHKINPASLAPSDSIPKPTCQEIMMLRSGTSGSTPNNRTFYWSSNLETVDNHHAWKIEQSHSLTNPGNIIHICVANNSIPYQPISRSGPLRKASLGLHNRLYRLNYTCRADAPKDNLWLSLKETRDLEPKYIRCSPSTIELLHLYFDGDKFSCPVVSSEETLSQRVRSMGEKMFSCVIDKMVCWDGSLGFFECPKGRKHVYDEFALIEFIDGQMVTTDLNNAATPFFRYNNKDFGEVQQGMCDCGLYGNYFTEFSGKTIECIYNGERLITGEYIWQNISKGLKLTYLDNDMLYRVYQRVDQTIEFIYFARPELNSRQASVLEELLDEVLRQKVTVRKAESVWEFERIGARSKSLEVRSDFVRSLSPEVMRNLRNKHETKSLL